MIRLLYYSFLLFCCLVVMKAQAQTARVYRSGALIGTYTTVAAASAAARTIGDSIVLSAHTFKEHDIDFYGGQTWQGTMTATDSTLIDAESKGVVGFYYHVSKKSLVFRDIILAHGYSNDSSYSGAAIGGPYGSGAGIYDSLQFRGRTIVRYCHADTGIGVADVFYAFDHAKIVHNSADIYAGVCIVAFLYDSVEVSYNSARYGAVAAVDTNLKGNLGGGTVIIYSPGVKIMHNRASVAGGVVLGNLQVYGGQILYNEAPLGAAVYVRSKCYLADAYCYNPGTAAEIYVAAAYMGTYKRSVELQGVWFGDSDTTGRIVLEDTSAKFIAGSKYTIADWSLNWGKTLGKSDTLFPIGAAMKYSDGSLPDSNKYRWLQDHFYADKGSFVNPDPYMGNYDSLSTLYRTFDHVGSDTGFRPVHFICHIDEDTFEVTAMVWGRSKLGIGSERLARQVYIYPNPVQNELHVRGMPSGTRLAVYDISGKAIASFDCTADMRIDSHAWPSGIYTLSFRDEEGQAQWVKISKE